MPDAATWARLSAADAGIDGARLDAAVAFACAHDSPWPQSLYYADGRYVGNVPYGVGKAGVEKLAADMAEELRPYGVASVSLWPGFIRTEDVLAQPDVYPDLSTTHSQLFPGRAVAALSNDPDVLARGCPARRGFSGGGPVRDSLIRL